MKETKKEKEREYQRLVEQESLILEATEMLSELIEQSGENRKELAETLGRSKGFVTQILSGDRNMTLRTLADFAFALEHRVKMKAAPLIEQGDGGEAVGTQAPAMARVYSGTVELLAKTEHEEASDDPRRPLAAEGAGPCSEYFIYCNAMLGSERAEEQLLWQAAPSNKVAI
jgi:antitoxin component HigA of HigAB toxin-antitoxin module